MRLTQNINDNYTARQLKLPFNAYIFEKDPVDLKHAYIDGSKLEANANRYTWVWKKSCIKNTSKVFEKITLLIEEMNSEVLGYLGIKFETRDEYAIDYVEEPKKYMNVKTVKVVPIEANAAKEKATGPLE